MNNTWRKIVKIRRTWRTICRAGAQIELLISKLRTSSLKSFLKFHIFTSRKLEEFALDTKNEKI